jgi:hypothetical protein
MQLDKVVYLAPVEAKPGRHPAGMAPRGLGLHTPVPGKGQGGLELLVRRQDPRPWVIARGGGDRPTR